MLETSKVHVEAMEMKGDECSLRDFSNKEQDGLIRDRDSLDVVKMEAKGIKKETDEFLGDSVTFVEREFFDFIQSGGIGECCNVEGEDD